MPIFLEKFVLPMLAAGVIAVIVLNPFKFDRHQRAGLLLVAVGLAYFAARSIQLESRVSQSESKDGVVSGPATALGDCNAANSGNGGKAEVTCIENDTTVKQTK